MVDRYTKCALTVIAACLAVLAFRDMRPITSAGAQSGPVHVIVDSVDTYAFQFTQPLKVKISPASKKGPSVRSGK
jgi:hypothetical protein